MATGEAGDNSSAAAAAAAALPSNAKVSVLCLESGDAAAASTPGGDPRAAGTDAGWGAAEVEGAGARGKQPGGTPGPEEGGGAGAGTGTRVAVMNIEGMTCAICVGIVENLLGRFVRVWCIRSR